MKADVEFVAHGRTGQAIYREGANVHAFDWEFGVDDVVLSIHVPSVAAWNAAVPWAAERRDEVIATIVREALRSHCVGCVPDFGDTRINLLESPRTRRL